MDSKTPTYRTTGRPPAREGRYSFLPREAIALLVIAVLLSCQSALAGAPILLGTQNKTKIAVSSGGKNERVGKGALVRVHLQTEGVAWSSTVLIGCDGTWISEPIHSWFEVGKQLTFSEIERLARAEEKPLPLEGVEIHDAANADQLYSGLLLRRAMSLCRSASREPRNVLIPFAGTGGDDETPSSYALVLGTVTTNANIVDAWTRRTWFKEVPIVDGDGNPIYLDGRVLTRGEPTGKYNLERVLFNCRTRQLATYEVSEYEAGKSAPQRSSLPRDKVPLDSAIPGSVGEALLDGICRLYAGWP